MSDVEVTESDLVASMQGTLAHIRRVQELLGDVAARLIERARLHDTSKLSEPEASVFAIYTKKLAGCTYGSAVAGDCQGRTCRL